MDITDKIQPIDSKCKACGKKDKVLLVHSIPLCFRCISDLMTYYAKEQIEEKEEFPVDERNCSNCRYKRSEINYDDYCLVRRELLKHLTFKQKYHNCKFWKLNPDIK